MPNEILRILLLNICITVHNGDEVCIAIFVKALDCVACVKLLKVLEHRLKKDFLTPRKPSKAIRMLKDYFELDRRHFNAVQYFSILLKQFHLYARILTQKSNM